MKQLRKIYIVTGAHDTGKSATLEYLKKEFGHATIGEAFKALQKECGEAMFFHAPDKPFVPNGSPDHVCPICRPKELTSMLLRKQLEIENGIAGGTTVIERGFGDYLATLRFLKIDDWENRDFSARRFAKYKLVFLMEVMPELQEPKFGKSLEQRIQEAVEINECIFQEYFQSGFKIVAVPAGTIKDRAKLIDIFLGRNVKRVPFSGVVAYNESHENILTHIHNIFNSRGLSFNSLLFRVTGRKHIMKVLRYGTDRAGFGKDVEDMIYASTKGDILHGMLDEDFSTAFKKIAITQEPHILVYDAEKFGQLRPDRQYVFLNSQDKLDALICVLKVRED